MSIKMFVNLPVKDLDASMTFYRALGFTFNPHFTDATAAAMVISAENYAMLLTHAKFASFTSRPIPDAKQTTGVLVALALENKAAVDAMLGKAIAAGGTEPRPTADHGFMYQRTFEDPDGHIWEPFWMDPAAIPG